MDERAMNACRNARLLSLYLLVPVLLAILHARAVQYFLFSAEGVEETEVGFATVRVGCQDIIDLLQGELLPVTGSPTHYWILEGVRRSDSG